MNKKLTFLITGAGRGIGFELLQFAVEDGHQVIALVRDPHNARALTQLQKAQPDAVQIIKADVSIESELSAAKEVIGARPIDVVVNNAGILLDSEEKLPELTMAALNQTFAVNTFAPLNVAKMFLPNLLAADAPKLINITSKMGSIADNGSGGYYAYRMSKAALNMFNKSFSVGYPKVTALVLHPGWVRTQMGGSTAPVLPRESARGLYKIIMNYGLEHSGKFYDFNENAIPW